MVGMLVPRERRVIQSGCLRWLNAMMAHLPAPERESIWNEVAAAMGCFEVGGECLLVAATK
ncbi:hypothetical protein D3C80_1873680 [compost metagenome]